MFVLIGHSRKRFMKNWVIISMFLSSDKRILFSVRYSEELLKMLQERCENIEIIKK